MTPQFTPHVVTPETGADGSEQTAPSGDPRFRGSWAHAAVEAHRDAFSPSETYGRHDWQRASATSGPTATTSATPGTATTTVDAEGYTAIRVNLPPIGFNKARVSIQIESTIELDLIDLEVPAVVVIDPGHGGRENVSGSNANNATARPSGTLERDMSLSYGLQLKRVFLAGAVTDNQLVRIGMTRSIDNFNPEGSARAERARDNGADVFFSIHFNASDKHTARGSEALVRGNSNVNESEDTHLARRILNAIIRVVTDNDPVNANDRGVKNYAWSKKLQKDIPSEWAVLSDTSYNNDTSYHPIRGTIAEIDFIDVASGDELLNTGQNAGSVREEIVNSIREAIISDIRVQPN